MTTAAPPAAGYRDLLRPAHVPAFLAAALVGRLSQGVAGLATLLLVQRATGSYAVAGAAVACLGGTAAVLAPARTRWVHRRGPARALPLLAGGHGLVLAVVALAGARLGSTPAALPALCALAGCLTPPLGPVTRGMWSAVTPQPDLLRRAYSLDAAADEVLFTIGPVVAAFAVALAGPGAGVLVTAVLAVAGSLGVAASPLVSRSPVRADPPTDGRTAAPLRAPGFARLLTVMFGVGTALGGIELVAVGLDGYGGASAVPGMLVATVALGGVVGSVAYGRRTWRRAPGSQLGVLCVALTCALLATLAATAGPALLPVALFCSGLVVAPALVVGYGLAERLTHRSTHPEAGALVGTANNLGISVGTALTALVLDGAGAAWALLAVAAVAAGTAAARPTRIGSRPARRAAVPARRVSKKMSRTMSRPAARLRPRGGCGHRGRTARRRPDMAKYLFLKHYRGAPEAVNNVPMDQWTPQEVDDHVQYMNDFAARLQSTGEFVDGQALSPEGTFVRYDGEGRPPVTDGPFAETKDLIAGWMVVDVDTYERALALAGELSAAPGAGGKPIHEWLEVRPFLHAAPTVTE